MEMAKYLLARERRRKKPDETSGEENEPSLHDLLGKKFWTRFRAAFADDTILVRILDRCLKPPGDLDLVVAIRPVWKGGYFERLEISLDSCNREDSRKQWEQIKPDVEALIDTGSAVISPMLSLSLDQPPDPDCCKYRDFARGIAEFAWLNDDPADATVEPGLGIIAPDQPAFEAGRATLMHAYTTFEFICSARVDYGYSCIAGAGPGRARVFAMGYLNSQKRKPPPSTRARSQGDNLIFVCHGIHQTSKDVDGLTKQLRAGHTAAKRSASRPTGGPVPWLVIPRTYGWWRPVLLTGVELAKFVDDQVRSTPNCRSVTLLGYSQGGLVCRVAAAALSAADRLKLALVSEKAYIGTQLVNDTLIRLDRLNNPAAASNVLKGVITLATPNSGVLTHGQQNVVVSTLSDSYRKVRAMWKVKDLADLLTPRLAVVLQHLSIDGLKYLSVSGSYFNRFEGISRQKLKNIKPAKLPAIASLVLEFGPRLTLPNDGIVEEQSADLRQAVFKPEVANLDDQHEHLRLYLENTEVFHSDIFLCEVLIDEIKKRIARWIVG
jgi:hypothetical protein